MPVMVRQMVHRAGILLLDLTTQRLYKPSGKQIELEALP